MSKSPVLAFAFMVLAIVLLPVTILLSLLAALAGDRFHMSKKGGEK